MALQCVRRLYALDTLDTRFVVPATAPPKEALEQARRDPAAPQPVHTGTARPGNAGDRLQPARWRTLEFGCYYVSIAASIYCIIKLVYDVSKGTTWQLLPPSTRADTHRIPSKLPNLLACTVGWLDPWAQSRRPSCPPSHGSTSA